MITVRDAEAADVDAMSEVLIRSITELCAPDHRNDPAAIAAWTANKTSEGVRRMLKIRILIEACISGTAFGNSATGGGLNSGLFPALTGGTPDGSGAD